VRIWLTAYLLAMTLAVAGCGGAGDRDPSQAGSDGVEMVSAHGTDTTSAPELAPDVALRIDLERLLRGDAAPASGETWFSEATAGALRNVSLDAAGHATVDFADLRVLIPNASSSAGSAMLLDELNTAVFGVGAVRSVEYRIEGSCEQFWEWLQYSCQTVRRPE
jgi:hypothetical protein